MAIELSVKITRPSTSLEAFLEALSRRWSGCIAPGAELTIEHGPLPTFGHVGEEGNFVDIRVTDRAWIRCLFLNVGYEEDFEGGLWGTIAVGYRERESVLLMYMAAASLAEVAGSTVTDEVGYFKRGRFVSVEHIDQVTLRHGILELPEAAEAVTETDLWRNVDVEIVRLRGA